MFSTAGRLTFPRNGICSHGGERTISLPVQAYLIERPEDAVLADTSFPTGCATDPAAVGEALAAHPVNVLRRTAEDKGIEHVLFGHDAEQQARRPSSFR